MREGLPLEADSTLFAGPKPPNIARPSDGAGIDSSEDVGESGGAAAGGGAGLSVSAVMVGGRRYRVRKLRERPGLTTESEAVRRPDGVANEGLAERYIHKAVCAVWGCGGVGVNRMTQRVSRQGSRAPMPRGRVDARRVAR